MKSKVTLPRHAPPSLPTAGKAVRRWVEEIAWKSTNRLPKDLKEFSPEEMRQTIYALVHQLNLDMQRQEQHQGRSEVGITPDHYFDLYNRAPVGYFTLSETGLILEANLMAATLVGMPLELLIQEPIARFILQEDQGIHYLHTGDLLETGESQVWEMRMIKKDGTLFWVHLTATAALYGGLPVCRVVLTDITERKVQENERNLTVHLNLLVASSMDFIGCMSDLTASLQNWSECDAVGIRLRIGDDYSYYETHGSPPLFIHQEQQPCSYGPDEGNLPECAAKPILECLCGNNRFGRCDPTQRFFTDHGSFWTHSILSLLASVTGSDCPACLINRCSLEGYESVALIPLCMGHQVFGLIQFKDPRPGYFNPEVIAAFERVTNSLAISMSRRQSEAALKKRESRFRTLFEASPVAIVEQDLSGVKSRFDELNRDGISDFRYFFERNPDEVTALVNRVRVLNVNQQGMDLLGTKSTEYLSRELPGYFTADSLRVFKEAMIALTQGERVFHTEITIEKKAGARQLYLALSVPPEHTHNLSCVLVSFLDITQPKRSETVPDPAHAMLRGAMHHSTPGSVTSDAHGNAPHPIKKTGLFIRDKKRDAKTPTG